MNKYVLAVLALICCTAANHVKHEDGAPLITAGIIFLGLWFAVIFQRKARHD